MKYRIVIFNSLLVAVVAFLLFRSFKKEDSLVYIDTPKLMSKYEGAIQAQKILDQNSMLWKANMDTLQSELQSALAKFEKERVTMSAREIKLSEELLKTKQQQFMQYQQALEQKAQQESGKIREKIISEVNSYLKEFGESHSYKFILGATANGSLVYANQAYDVTDDVINGLNQKYQSAAK
jgi:outer membrane protein